MERAVLFAGLLLLAALYALVRGGAPERWAASFYLAAYVLSATAIIGQQSTFDSIEWLLFTVDIALAIALIILALHANRYWTIWAASLQLVAITAHLAKMMVPEILAPAYATTLIVWSYAAVAILTIGTWRRRQRLARHGREIDWSPQ